MHSGWCLFFTLGFLAINIMIRVSLGTLRDNPKCDCAQTWKADYIAALSTGCIVLSTVNLVLPFTRIINNIPIVSTIFTWGLVLGLVMYMFVLSSLADDLFSDKCSDICKIDNVPGSSVLRSVKSMDTTYLIVLGIGMGIGLLYFN